MKKILSLILAAGLTTVILGAGTPAALAKAAVVKTGRCSGTSPWKLTLNMDAGRIEADSEIQTHKAGQVWKSRFFDNGVLFGGAAKATAADGSTSSTRLARNRVGPDHITVRSRNMTTGELCVAQATF